MKRLSSCLLLFLFFFTTTAFAQDVKDVKDVKALKAQAEKLYAQGSYQLAHEAYRKIDAQKLSKSESKWVEFRLADTQWRAQAQSNQSDTSDLEAAQAKLQKLWQGYGPNVAKDETFVALAESLGDYWWMRPNSRNWYSGWGYYQGALEYWASSSDLGTARKKYLDLIWRLSDPPWQDQYYYYGYYGNYLPVNFVDNAIKIAKDKNDIAHAHYLLASSLRQFSGDEQTLKRIPSAFEAALSQGKQTPWYDDALFNYAEFYLYTGEAVALKEGGFRREPSFEKALVLYRRLLSEFRQGETRYYPQAKSRIDEITKPTLSLGVSRYFLPDSEIEYILSYRNLKTMNFALYEVNLGRDVKWSNTDTGMYEWLKTIDLSAAKKIHNWKKEVKEKTDYKPRNETLYYDKKLPIGAYILEVRTPEDPALAVREVVLITDGVLVVKTANQKVLTYFAEALNGAPIADAAVTLFERYYEGNRWHVRKVEQKTSADGLSVFNLEKTLAQSEIFISAQSYNRQAFSLSRHYHYDSAAENWKLYVFTDRPTYRPDETVSWKLIARRKDNGVLVTPSNIPMEYRIYDSRGVKVKEGKLSLNAFGSAWDTLPLKKENTLGGYRIEFLSAGGKANLGSSEMFRLEEYKLPEFKVAVVTPTENGKKKSFRLGETVEAEIAADYYFGGGVPNANIEVVIYQNTYHYGWAPVPFCGFMYPELDRGGRGFYPQGQGDVVKRETLKTDAKGRVKVKFETPAGLSQDMEYTIEARVTDLSRREIIAKGSVRVTRQSYFVSLNASHQIFKPRERVRVNVKTQTPNDDPVAVEGEVKVFRNRYKEIWIDASGTEVPLDKVNAYRKYKVKPSDLPQFKPYQLKSGTYEEEEILSTRAKTNSKGEAEVLFTVEKDGYYTVRWTSIDSNNEKIQAQTQVFVADEKTNTLGYRHGGLEIILDQDTFRPGENAPVMLFAPVSDRYVLFAVESEDLMSYQVLHLTGTVKLVQVPIEDKHVPNVFLSANMVADAQVYQTQRQVLVPPVKNFLDVKVKAAKKTFEPREEAMLTVETMDHTGQGIASEVALALVDEAVFYLGDDPAGDPRKFFFGDMKPLAVQNASSLTQHPLQRLIRDDKGVVRDEREYFPSDQAKRNDLRSRQELGRLDYPASVGLAKDEMVSSEMVAQKSSAMNAPAPLMERKMKVASVAGGKEMDKQASGEVVVRSDFRATAFWQPNIITGRDGRANIKIKFPDSLTNWQVKTTAVTLDQKVGRDDSLSVQTTQPLMVRLQAPRFFVVGDEVTLSAIVNNNTEKSLTVAPKLEAKGLDIKSPQSASLTLLPNTEKRVDWTATIAKPGKVTLKVSAQAGNYGDAMEKTYVAYEHGIEKLLARSTKAKSKETIIKIDLPKARRPGSTHFSVQVAPSLAVTMLDALPYLIDYPYGCTEQTMSRFMPTVVVLKTLADLSMSREMAANKIFGGIEAAHVEKTQAKGKKDLEKIDVIVKGGLQRLYDFQHGDGGWGWWKEGSSDYFMTAYVLQGLVMSEQAGVSVRGNVMERAAKFLEIKLVEEEKNFDMQSWMLYALSTYRAVKGQGPQPFEKKAFENLFENRAKLNAYTRALTTLAASHLKYLQQAQILVDNLENGVKWDKAPDQSIIQKGSGDAMATATAHWGEDGMFWRWSEGGVEATAWGLRALLAVNPKHRLVEPVTQWLIKNRRGAQWSNTRDTAMVILALSDYLRKSGELKQSFSYTVTVNGQKVVEKPVDAAGILSAPSVFSIDEKYLRDGVNEIKISKTMADAPLYVSAYANFFSQEEPIKGAGNEIFAHRQYYQVIGRETLLKGKVLEEKNLEDQGEVASNDRIQVVLTIEAKNNYEYLLFEDFKPAGFEAVQLKSGAPLYARELKSKTAKRRFVPNPDDPSSINDAASDYTNRSAWVYQELRDQKAAFFIDKLKEGIWEIRYELRAEVPGKFHALPLQGQAMYVPEIRTNGDEVRVTVK